MNNKLLIGIIITIVVIIGGVFFLSQNSGQSSTLNTADINQPSSNQSTISGLPAVAPQDKTPIDFTLPKYDGSSDVNLATFYKDKPTVIQFWATWCEICRHEFPDNNKIMSKYKDKVNYIAVDWAQGDKQAIAGYIKELNLDPNLITFVMDADGSVGAKYGVRGTPVHIFIKKGGEVIFKNTGGLSSQGFEALIQKMI